MSKELLKQAADQIELLEKQLAAKTEENVKLAKHIESEKTASEKRDADDAKAHADLAAKAKVAGDKLAARGLLSTPERAAQWTAIVAGSHGGALDALAKVADYTSDAPKVATVVNANGSKVASADSVWDERVSNWNNGAGRSR